MPDGSPPDIQAEVHADSAPADQHTGHDHHHHHPPKFHVGQAYRRHFADPRRERAFLSSVGFTTAFATCRIVTHSIKAGVGPFKNMSVGGRHLHHSTFGILGQIGLGFVWTYQYALGVDPRRRAASRTGAVLYGVASALTLDEFALWFDLQDDYWDAAGRKSIDAVALFGGISTMGLAGHPFARECVKAARAAGRDAHSREHSHEHH